MYHDDVPMTDIMPYVDFVKYSIGSIGNLPTCYEIIDWGDFLLFCNRQGITGLVFDGIQRAGIRFDVNILLEWIGAEQLTIQQNAIINKRLKETVEFFDKRGLRSCILKGQANGLMYPNPKLRSPGDIDIWVEGKREDIIKMVLSIMPDAHYSIHHIKMPIYEDVSVEVHYRPIYMYNWQIDKKLQRYILREENRQFSNKMVFGGKEIGCLTNDFNVVYQMLHMYHHFFETRNNFKQFIDYYYLLNQRLSKEEKDNCVFAFKELKVLKYASGIMWIMKEVLGLQPSLLLIEPNEKEGRLILRESYYVGDYSTNKLVRVLARMKSNIRILKSYPLEVVINPFFLMWHQWWKLKVRFSLQRM